MPSFIALNQVVVMRPGTASTFDPNDGMVQAWITSLEVTSTCTTLSTGTSTSLSTARLRGTWPAGIPALTASSRSLSCSITESTEMPWSGYSCVQFQAWPTALIVRSGGGKEYWKQSSLKDGMAIATSTRTGSTVHRISTVVLCVVSDGTGLRFSLKRHMTKSMSPSTNAVMTKMMMLT